MECSGTRVRHHQSWAWGDIFGAGVCEGQQGTGKRGEAPNQSGAPAIGQIGAGWEEMDLQPILEAK